MQADTARTFLMERQRLERLTTREMARRLEMDETTWSKVRSGSRRMTAAQVLRACVIYRDLRDLLFSEKAS